jgi:hypothetical protein
VEELLQNAGTGERLYLALPALFCITAYREFSISTLKDQSRNHVPPNPPHDPSSRFRKVRNTPLIHQQSEHPLTDAPDLKSNVTSHYPTISRLQYRQHYELDLRPVSIHNGIYYSLVELALPL